MYTRAAEKKRSGTVSLTIYQTICGTRNIDSDVPGRKMNN